MSDKAWLILVLVAVVLIGIIRYINMRSDEEEEHKVKHKREVNRSRLLNLAVDIQAERELDRIILDKCGRILHGDFGFPPLRKTWGAVSTGSITCSCGILIQH